MASSSVSNENKTPRRSITVARTRAHFRFVVSVLFAIFCSVFVQFCVSGLASCLRFVSVLLPFRCCIVCTVVRMGFCTVVRMGFHRTVPSVPHI